MNDINQLTIIGRLTRDPEFKRIGENSHVSFSIANGRKFKDKEETSFFDCEAWGKLADILNEYAKKGKQVCINGRIKQETWDSPDGKRSKVKIICENVQLLGAKTENNSNGQPEQENYDSEITDEDMVF